MAAQRRLYRFEWLCVEDVTRIEPGAPAKRHAVDREVVHNRESVLRGVDSKSIGVDTALEHLGLGVDQAPADVFSPVGVD